MRTMRMMGYHVIGVGEKDLAAGVKVFQDSSAKTGKLYFKPYAIESVGGIKVGIFSVLSPTNGFQAAPMNVHPDSLKYLDVEETVRKTVAELRSKCQVVVGLLNLGNTDADSISRKVPGMDLAIVGGKGPSMVPKGVLLPDHTLEVSAGTRGQHMARSVVALQGGKVKSIDADVVPLGEHYPESEAMANLRKDFEDNLNDRLAQRERESGMATAAKHGPDHYLGQEACAKCHSAQYDVWLKTAHASAWTTLTTRKKDSMPDCVPCHVTGYKQNGGFFSNLNPGLEVDGQKRHLENVQCEACHGMGTQHNTGEAKFVHTSHKVCANCHTPEQDPKFNFEVAWAKIAH